MQYELVDPTIEVVTARTESEIEEVYRIRYDAYAQAGHIHVNDHRKFSDNYDHTMVAASHLAYIQHDPIGTLRTVIDSEQHRLPMDREGFSKYLDPLRRQGRRLAEICRLALLDKQHGKHKKVLLALEKAMFYHALANGVNDLVIVVSPEHAPRYEQVLLFKRCSDVQLYPSLQRMAVLLRLDITNLPWIYRNLPTPVRDMIWYA